MDEFKDTNGWNEYKSRVIYQLEELGKKQDLFNDKLDKLIIDVTILKTKAAFYGGGAALIVTVIVQIIAYAITHGKVA